MDVPGSPSVLRIRVAHLPGAISYAMTTSPDVVYESSDCRFIRGSLLDYLTRPYPFAFILFKKAFRQLQVALGVLGVTRHLNHFKVR